MFNNLGLILSGWTLRTFYINDLSNNRVHTVDAVQCLSQVQPPPLASAKVQGQVILKDRYLANLSAGLPFKVYSVMR
jgi:hypothetical protein